jgi:hypothetical protein
METEIRLEVQNREPFDDGVDFGDVGPYERLDGRVHFALDPDDSANDSITDIEHAPRGDDGLVEFAADVSLLKPEELDAGNERLLYGVNNRGDKRLLQYFNDAVESNAPSAPDHAGNGFLMRRGYTIVWSGWQGNLLPGDGRLLLEVPIARDDGEAITGPTRSEFCVDHPGIASLPLSGNEYTRSYAPVSFDGANATLTVRPDRGEPRQRIPADSWSFAHAAGYEPSSSPAHIHYPDGFDVGHLYELVYTARDPPVLGLGFAGVRDLISFLRHDETDREGTPNPLREDGTAMDKAYAWGISQAGRFLREFVYRGFNEGVDGTRVFDAILPHAAGGGRLALDLRFAQPGRYPRQHREHLYPSDQFPFAYDVVRDPLTGRTDGICKRPQTDPFVVHTQTSTEYWSRRGSLVHTRSDGTDLGQQDGVRIYLFASTQHSSDPSSGGEPGRYANLSNPLSVSPLLRALLDATDAWATDGCPPPDSRIPTRQADTLVPPAAVRDRFPDLPGVELPRNPNRLYVQDFGPRFDDGIISTEPPEEDHDKEYTLLVPSVDTDGNDVPGVRSPHIQVPIGTLTGWNLRTTGPADRTLAGVTGSYLPFAETEPDRRESGDPRPSRSERYDSNAQYVRLVATATHRLVDDGLLLDEDADRYVKHAIDCDRSVF